jgi:hypothetical protein
MLRFAPAGARYVAGWMAAERVKRLKDLVDRLERLPASEDRDRVLSEVRSRAVDLDTGVTPRAMLPLREPILAEPAPRRYRPASITRTVVAPSARPVETAPPAVAANDHDEWLSIGPLLSLDDASEPHVQGPGGQSVPPWTLGLRG